MGIIGKQFGSPSGVIGRIAARFMARNNAVFNQGLIEEVVRIVPDAAVVAEIGFGPGVGLTTLLGSFPHAQIVGADPSSVAVGQAKRRNREAVDSGRLRLREGDAQTLREFAPVDVVIAVHVLYFWHDPVVSLRHVRDLLSPGGRVALGYQLKQHMPRPAQRDFPREGHVLYESDDEVQDLLQEAGFGARSPVVLGPPDAPLGRVLVGQRVE